MHHTGPHRATGRTAQGIYHRDLRMENLLLDGQYNSPTLKISDFAYSKNAVLDSQPKTNVGSPSYTPPELLLAVRNEGSAYDGAAIDVWSSGVILFFMLTGQLPFQAPPPPGSPSCHKCCSTAVVSVGRCICRGLNGRVSASEGPLRAVIFMREVGGLPAPHALLPQLHHAVAAASTPVPGSG